MVPRRYYGGAWSADSAYFFYTVHDEAYRPFQVWRHALGTPVRRGRAGARGARRALRAARPGDPQRRAGRDLVGEPGHHARSGWSTRTDPLDPPRSVGGRRAGRGVPRRARRAPGRSDCLLVVTNDGATEFRLARCPVPRDADQDHTAWQPVRPEDPDERLERVDAFATHVGAQLPLARPAPAARAAGRRPRLPRLRGRPAASRPAPSTWRTTRTSTPRPSPSSTSPTSTRRSGPTSTCAPGERTERHRQEAPGHDPDALRRARRAPSRPPDGTPVPATLVRHRDTPLDGTAPALLYGYGAYEACRRPGVGPRAAEPARPRGGLRPRPTSAAAARAAAAGGSTAACEHKQHTFTDHARGGGRARRARGRLPPRPPAGSAPAACSRARCSQPATGPVAGRGGRGAVRRRGHHDARPVRSR